MTTLQQTITILVAASIMPAIFTYLLYVARTIGRKDLISTEKAATAAAASSRKSN